MAIEEEIGQEFQEEPAAEMPVAEQQPVEEEVVAEEEVIEAPAGEAGPGTPPKKQQGQVQILPGKGGQKTVVPIETEPNKNEQVQKEQIKTLSKDADSPNSFLNFIPNPAKNQQTSQPATFTEVVKKATEEGEAKRPEIERKASVYKKFEENQQRKISIKRKIDEKQKYIDYTFNESGNYKQPLRYGGKQEYNEALQQIENWKPGLEFWEAESKKSLDATNKELESEINNLWEENKDRYAGSPGLVKESKGGVLSADMAAVQDIAKKTAKKYGLSEDGYFYTLLKTKLAAKADAEIDTKKAKEEADRAYLQTYGKTFEQSQKDAIEIAKSQNDETLKAKNELSLIAKEIYGYRETAQKELENIYTEAIKGVNDEINKIPEVQKFTSDTLQNAIAELQKRVNNNEISYEDAVALSESKEFADSLNKKIETFVAENYGQMYSASFEQYMKDLNTVNTKYNSMYRRREEEVIRMAEQKMNQLGEKAKNLDATSVERYKKIYGEKYKEVRRRRKAEEKYDADTFTIYSAGTISSLGAGLKGYGSALGIKQLEDFGERLSSDFAVPEWSIKEFSDLWNKRAFAGSVSSIVGRGLPGMTAGALTALTTRNASLTWQIISQAFIGFTTDTLDQVGTIQAEVFERTGDIAAAENAGREMLKSQIAIAYSYSTFGMPFFGNKLFGNIFKKYGTKGAIAGGLTAGTLDLADESFQEILQTSFEESIKETGKASNFRNYVTWQNSKAQILNLVPMSVVSGGGPIFAKGVKDYTLNQYAKAQVEGFVAKENVADYIKNNKLQYMYNLFEQKGGRFSKQYAAMMFSNGGITEQELQQLTKKIDDFENFKAATKKAKMEFADNVAGFTLYDNLQQSKAALDAEKDEGAKIMLQQNYNAAKAEWESFTKGEGTNAVILSMPSGEKFVLSPEDADKMLEDDAVKQDIKDGKIGVQVFAKKGQEAVMQTTADKMNVLFEQKPTLTKFTSPTDEKYGTVNRNDGKGEVTLTKEEFLREQGAISGVQKGVEGVPSAEPTEAGAAPTAMGEEGAKAEQAVTPEPAAPEGTKPESLTKPSELFDRVDLNEALEGQDLVNNIDETERKFSPEKMKQAGVITDNFDTIMRDMEKKGKIKIDCPPLTKASKGLAIGFIPGGTWEVVETFSGPTHKEGGIKIEIEGTEISYADADEDIQGKAKNGGFWGTMKNVGLFLGDTGLTALGHVIRNNSLKNVINEENYGSKNWDNASRAVAVGVSGTTLLNPNKVINEFNMMKMESEMNKLSKEATKKQKELDWAKKSQPYSSETKMNVPNTPEPIKPKKTDLGDSSSQDNIIKPSI